MHDSMTKKLDMLIDRQAEIQNLLIQPETSNDINLLTELNKEFADINPIAELYSEYKDLMQVIEEAKQIIEMGDEDLMALAEEDLKNNQDRPAALEKQLKIMLLPKDSADDGSAYLEIRAGAGGDEAGIFAGDLFRMYSRMSERENWTIEVLNLRPAEQGGYKEVSLKLVGKGVYKVLKFESGVHRVQRVPETESQGRIHTSTCTVAILPEVEAVAEVSIDKNDLRVDTFRASGAGGQHVNKTDSAIRITHEPTGIVVECQEERSQHQNKERAMTMLRSKMYDIELEKKQKERAANRKSQVSTGDRSAKIRTYNFPQGRITDHRINLTLYSLDSAMKGDINEVIQALRVQENLEKMQEISD